MNTHLKIYVAGHRGLVGSAIVRTLGNRGYSSIIGRTHHELELTDQRAVNAFFAQERPEWVFLAAARVGGIHANNTYPAEFAYSNMQIQNNIVHAAWQHDVKKLCFLGSSCIFPKMAPQPMREEHLMTGPLEPTNAPYALAKIAGIVMCQSYNRQYGTNYISVMPTNLYGPGDNYHPENSHVLPGLIRRFHEAKLTDAPAVTIWGTGTPQREFLYSDDLADACVFLMETYNSSDIVNIGSGHEVTIRELAETIRDVTGYKGGLAFDASKPDGTPRKLLDCSKLYAMGWRPKVGLREGIRRAYEEYVRSAE